MSPEEIHVIHQRRRIALACLVLLLSASGAAIAQTTPPAGAPAQPPAAAVDKTVPPASTVVAEKAIAPPSIMPAAKSVAPTSTTPVEKAIVPTTTAPAAEEPRVGHLVLDADAACELRVGGAAQKPVLLPGTPRTVSVPPGESVIECNSTTVPEAKVKLVRDVAAGDRQSIRLEVADLVVKASCAGKPATLADLGNGTLRHCVTRVDWTQADNGADTDWEGARAWCAKKGEGWALPTANELAELIDRSGGSSTTCATSKCHVSSLFRLSAPTYWSREANGPATAMLVHLLLGGRHPALVGVSRGYRALCVRSPAA